jgi:cytochrome b561
LTHAALYALLLVVPILGLIVHLKRGHALPVFGFFEFSSPWPTDRPLARSILTVHYYLANTLIVLAGFHACAALVHHRLWRDRTLVRMLPGTR